MIAIHYRPGTQVVIDGDTDLLAWITRVQLAGKELSVLYECSWMHSGNSYSAWFQPFRLGPAGVELLAGFELRFADCPAKT